VSLPLAAEDEGDAALNNRPLGSMNLEEEHSSVDRKGKETTFCSASFAQFCERRVLVSTTVTRWF
jgi:hypothetical protein